MVKTHLRYPYPTEDCLLYEINYLDTSSISFIIDLRNQVRFFMFQKKSSLLKNSKFFSNIQLRILPIKKFRVGNDDKKVTTLDFCFSNYLLIHSRKRNIFLERFVIFNKLSIMPWFIFGKKSFSNLEKLALFIKFFQAYFNCLCD